MKQYFILINAERPYSVLQVLHSALEAHARGSSSSQFTFTVIPGDQPEVGLQSLGFRIRVLRENVFGSGEHVAYGNRPIKIQ